MNEIKDLNGKGNVLNQNDTLRRYVGAVGVLIYILASIETPLYFIYSGPPPLSTVLTRILLEMFIAVGFLLFWSGLKQLFPSDTEKHKYLGTALSTLGVVYAVILLVATSIQAGGAWLQSTPMDPMNVGSGGEGALLLYGSIGRLLMALILLIGGVAVKSTKILPGWTSWYAFLAALFNLAMIPSIFFMSIDDNFYSANGWNIPIAGGAFTLWILIISIALLITRRPS